MPRLIFKCPYLKGGGENASHLGNYVRYMATRDGVQRVDPGKADWPATKNQEVMVAQLLRDFPMARGMFEYEDYLAAPTRANASEFITRCMEDNIDQIAKRENYVDYIAQRPRVQRLGQHGLFTDADGPITLSQVADEVAHHPGNVWLPILSLRREDAARLGYDDAKQWQALLSARAPDIAKAMKIPWEEFRWYAAFHDEGHHPHVHMVVYSADGRSGYLTRTGIGEIKSKLVKDIFAGELTELYQQQTVRRDALTAQARSAMEQAIGEMEHGTLENQRMEILLTHLAQQLKTVKGKKQYGYLKPQLKSVVDEIVDELERDPRIATAYEQWYLLREEVLRSYRDDLPERLPLSRQKEFKQIRNMVIQEAIGLGQVEIPTEEPEEAQEEKAVPTDVELLTVRAMVGNTWAQYALGKRYRDGEGVEKDILQAVIWFEQAAAHGNSYANYALGRLYLTGEDVPPDRERAIQYLNVSAQQGNEYAQRLLEHLRNHSAPSATQGVVRLLHHMSRIFREQTPKPPMQVSVVDRKLRRKIREKKIAMGHKPDDHEQKM